MLVNPPSEPGAVLLAPDRPALHWPVLTEQVGQAQKRLAACGIGPRDAVALAMPEGPDAISALLGILHTAWCAPLNPALTVAETTRALTQMRARLLVTLDGTATADVAARAARDANVPVLALKALPDAAGLLDWGEPRTLPPVPDAEPAYAAGPGLLLFTSATTGRAKLVPLHVRNVEAMVAGMRGTLPEADRGRVLLMTPFYHLQGILSALQQTASGGVIIATPGFRGESFPGWLKIFAPTQFTANPTLCRAILRMTCMPDTRQALRSLRFLTCAGAPLPAALRAELESALGIPIIEGYGLTEAGRVTMTPLDAREHRAGSVGRCCGPETAIMDEHGVLLPFGQEGEIVLRGGTLFEGYAHDPAATAAAFRNGWFRTGDLGRLDADGFLYVTGRLKEIINRGAEKILPYEIEEALARHPAVREAAVFGYPHPSLGEDVGACVVRGEPVTAPALRRFLSDILAPHKIPRRLVFADSIPKGATGKPQRARLAEQMGLPPPFPHNKAEPPPDRPLDDMETALAAIWVRLLQVPDIQAEDDFFLLGGDSLLATEMGLCVERELGVAFPADELVVSATLAETARRVRAARTAETAARPRGIRVFRPGGTGTPLILLPYSGNTLLAYGLLLRLLESNRPIYAFTTLRTEAAGPSLEGIAARHLELLREARPSGPYVLGGFSLGGVIAFEMARRLIHEGEHVEGVVLIDTLPGPLSFWNRFLYALRDGLRKPSRERLSFLRAKGVRLWQRLRHRAGPKKADGLSEQDRWWIWEQYHPQPQPLRALLIWCPSDGEVPGRPVLLARWRSLIGRNLQVCEVPGTHGTILAEPRVRPVAAAISRFLDTAQEASA